MMTYENNTLKMMKKVYTCGGDEGVVFYTDVIIQTDYLFLTAHSVLPASYVECGVHSGNYVEIQPPK